MTTHNPNPEITADDIAAAFAEDAAAPPEVEEPDYAHDLLLSADEYRQRGLQVFPLIPGTKNPAVKGWNDNDNPNVALTAERVQAWWGPTGAYYGYGIGIRTGQPVDGGYLFVYDVDCKPNKPNGYLWHDSHADAYGSGQPTYQVDTPSGGMHRYYISAQPISGRIGSVAPGIDIKGSGGYVVAPPTTINTPDSSGPYVAHGGRTLAQPFPAPPDWLAAAIVRDTPQPAPPARPRPAGETGRRPGDRFTADCDLLFLLWLDGWTVKERKANGSVDLWRPGKTGGSLSAVYNSPKLPGVLKVFSTNCEISRVHLPGGVQGYGYDAFTYWAHTRWPAGDALRQAAKVAAWQYKKPGARLLGLPVWVNTATPAATVEALEAEHATLHREYMRGAHVHDVVAAGNTQAKQTPDTPPAVRDPLEPVDLQHDTAAAIPDAEHVGRPKGITGALLQVVDFPAVTRGTGRTMPQLSPQFWEQTELLAALRDYANAWTLDREMLLAAYMVRYAALVPPNWRIPNPFYTPPDDDNAPLEPGDSMNFYALLVGEPGSGKTQAMKHAERLLPDPNNETEAMGRWVRLGARLGSGEGIAAAFIDNETGVQAFRAVSFDTDEGKILLSLAARQQSTLLPTLREAWTGGRLGSDNAHKSTTRRVNRDAYRLALTVGIQPDATDGLLAGADLGDPQRFLWVPGHDHTAEIGSGCAPRPQFTPPPRSEPVGIVRTLDMTAEIRHEIRARYIERRRDPLAQKGQEHADLLRNKTACLLALMHGAVTVDRFAWDLAGQLTELSAATQDYCAEIHRQADERKHQASVARHVDREAQTDRDRDARRLHDAAAQLARAVHTKGTIPRGKATAALSRWARDAFRTDDIIGEAVRRTWVIDSPTGLQPAAEPPPPPPTTRT